VTDLEPVITLLAANLGNLHDKAGDFIAYVPFLDDSDFARKIQQQLAEGLAILLDRHGMLHTPDTAPSQIVSLTCAQCGGTLITINLAHPVSGKQIIEHIAGLDPHCSTKHGKLTPDVIRQRIQEQMAETDAV
jgi:hypothetical protein